MLLVASYSLWLRFRPAPVAPGQVITAQPAHKLDGQPTIVIQPKQVIVYRDTVKVVEKLGIPQPAPQELVQQAVDLPPLKYGGVSATMLNMSSGQSRTVIKANDAPWFAFKSDNAIGVGYGVSSKGQTAVIRYRRDMLQVKNLIVSGELEGNYAPLRKDPLEGRAMVFGEIRW